MAKPRDTRNRNRRLQKAVRMRMIETGENYTKALRVIEKESETRGKKK